MKWELKTVYLTFSLVGLCLGTLASANISNHLILDLAPLATSANVSSGSSFGLSYDGYHSELKSTYTLTSEWIYPFAPSAQRMDWSLSLGFFTEITLPFALGARVGTIMNNPDQRVGFGALAFRLPALTPEAKTFFSFFFEEIDLGFSGAGARTASIRFGMKLL